MRTGKTGAERTQRYREILNGDPEKREEVLRKRRERYKEKKRKGELTTFRVNSLPPSQIKKLRESWRKAQLKYKTQKKKLNAVMNLTPPSPEMSFNNEMEIQPDPLPLQCSTPKNHTAAQNQESPSVSPLPSPSRAEIEKLKIKLRRQKNENKVLMRKLSEEKRKATNYKKLSQRQKIKKPRDEKHHLPRGKSAKNEKKNQVESFLLLDENSILLPGKKDTIGRKEKKQRRVLTSSLKDLHQAYMQKCAREHRLSYRQFTRYRPFYVTEAKPSDRNTCACYQHENMCLLVDSLAKRGLIKTKSLSALLSTIVCNLESERCMYRMCTQCCFDEVQLSDHNPIDTATW
ncbi:unnamed protein product [Arctogadus glacialis]